MWSVAMAMVWSHLWSWICIIFYPVHSLNSQYQLKCRQPSWWKHIAEWWKAAKEKFAFKILRLNFFSFPKEIKLTKHSRLINFLLRVCDVYFRMSGRQKKKKNRYNIRKKKKRNSNRKGETNWKDKKKDMESEKKSYVCYLKSRETSVQPQTPVFVFMLQQA